MNQILLMLQGKKTHWTCAAIVGLLIGQWAKWWTIPPEVYGVLVTLALMFLRAGVSREISEAAEDPSLPDSQANAGGTAATATPANTTAPGAAGKTILPLAISLAAAVMMGLAGCQSGRLESGGAYSPLVTNTIAGTNAVTAQPDMAFYIADAAYQTAWKIINAAFDFEYNNRAALWKLSPQIKLGLDGIRPDAVKANADYLRARAAYMANPVAPNLDVLQSVLAKLQQLSTTAQSLLPKQN